jgi:predicted nucleic acid-binding protein
MGTIVLMTIAAGVLVALDTPVLIYAMERHPIFGKGALQLLQRIEAGEVRACASVVIITEFLTATFARFDAPTAARVRRGLAGLKIAYSPVSEAIAFDAARLRAVHRLKTPDALHLATALANRADLFVTNDRRLDRIVAQGMPTVQISLA